MKIEGPSKQILPLRDAVLESLRIQFKTKIASIQLTSSPGLHLPCPGPAMEKLITDIANNIVQGLLDETLLQSTLNFLKLDNGAW